MVKLNRKRAKLRAAQLFIESCIEDLKRAHRVAKELGRMQAAEKIREAARLLVEAYGELSWEE